MSPLSPEETGNVAHGPQADSDNGLATSPPWPNRSDTSHSYLKRKASTLLYRKPSGMDFRAAPVVTSNAASNASTPSGRLRDGMMTTPNPVIQYDQLRSKKTIEAYQVATQILEDVAGNTSTAYFTPYRNTQDSYVTPYGPPKVHLDPSERDYVTPYGPPEISWESSVKTDGANQATPKTNASGLDAEEPSNANGVHTESVASSTSQEHVIDHAQVDRLLFLAGGDSLTDEDDSDDEIEVLASFTKAQPDADLAAIVKHLLETLASRDDTGTQQAINLQSAIDQGSLVKNLIIPKDQSQVTSRFYTTLASRAQGSSRPSGCLHPQQGLDVGPLFTSQGPNRLLGPTPLSRPAALGEPFPPPQVGTAGNCIPNPIHDNLSGNSVPSAISNQPGSVVTHRINRYGRLVPTGGVVPTIPTPEARYGPFVPSNMPPPPVPSRVGIARGKTVEEAKKVRDYGFPPLPSSRPGK